MTWVQTFSGIKFDLLKPRPEMFSIRDIARSLSMVNRFSGHTAWPYSVAQHSVIMSRMVSPEHALEALMHDATEAYVGDIPGPLKRLAPWYAEIERVIYVSMADRFGIQPSICDEVSVADRRMLITEQQQLVGEQVSPWHVHEKPYDVAIEEWHYSYAELQFIMSFSRLSGSGSVR